MAKNLFCLIVLLLSISTFAQENINTDRPDQTESPAIVPVKRYQAEAGFVHQQTGKGAYELSTPTLLSRFGITNGLEVRLETDMLIVKEENITNSGLAPVKAGLKVNLWHEKSWLPETSLIVHLQLPKAASKRFRASYIAPELILAMDNALTPKAGIGYNLGCSWDGESARPVYMYSVSPGFELTDKLSCFIESYGYLPEKEKPEHWLDGGFMYLLTKDIQLDIAGGYKLSGMNGFYETLGISIRI